MSYAIALLGVTFLEDRDLASVEFQAFSEAEVFLAHAVVPASPQSTRRAGYTGFPMRDRGR
ncbi:hypothetical protein D3C75_1330400 [compost metagenome]